MSERVVHIHILDVDLEHGCVWLEVGSLDPRRERLGIHTHAGESFDLHVPPDPRASPLSLAGSVLRHCDPRTSRWGRVKRENRS
jgi:hypothetical protein